MVVTVLVHIGKTGASNGMSAKMVKLANTGVQSIRDLSERLSSAELAKHHRNELIPSIDSLGGFVSLVLLN